MAKTAETSHTQEEALATLRAGSTEAHNLSYRYYKETAKIPNSSSQRTIDTQVKRLVTQIDQAKSPEEQERMLQALEAMQETITETINNENKYLQQKRRQEGQATKRSAGQVLGSSYLGVPPGKDVRFVDALITIAVAGGSVLWTASRNHQNGSDVIWATFWTLLGAVMAVEGSNELRYGGFGVSSANAAYLMLALVGGIEPKVL